MSKIKTFLDNLQTIPSTAKIFLLQNLFIMLKTGVSLADALETLSKQTKNKKLKKILDDIYEKIKKGQSFGEILETYQKDFGELFVNMVKAGEASGRLEEVLHELYLQSKKNHDLVMKVRNALTYPTVIVIAMLGISTFMIVFVLPNITALFKDLKVPLPITTRIMIAVSDFVQQHGIVVVIGLVILITAFIKIVRTKKGKYLFDLALLKMPIVSGIVIKINLAMVARNLSSLIKTDIAIVDSLNITARIVGNSLYKKALVQLSEKVKKGEKMAQTFAAYPQIFPAVIIQMVAVGEETGALDEVLENLAGFYEEEVFETMNSLPAIIEPILMLLIGGAVAVIALAIMMPMYSLTESF